MTATDGFETCTAQVQPAADRDPDSARDECVRMAEELLEMYLPGLGWRFRFDSSYKRGGLCVPVEKVIQMSSYLVPVWTTEQVRQTLLHEVAHALAHERGIYRTDKDAHGPEWFAIARSIGYTEGVHHSNPTLQTPRSYEVDPDTTSIIPMRGEGPGGWITVQGEYTRMIIDHVTRQILLPNDLSRLSPVVYEFLRDLGALRALNQEEHDGAS